MKTTRRELLGAAAVGAVVARCGYSPAKSTPARHWPVSNVSIVKAPAYTMDVYDAVYRILVEHKLSVRGKRVVLKPNLVEFDPHTAINTHPLVVHAAFEAFRKLGAAEVKIAEGPGHRRATLDLADAAGYFSTVPKFEDNFTDLNLDNVARRVIPAPVSQ
jgi:uncharacterized protein (DUF362 family)